MAGSRNAPVVVKFGGELLEDPRRLGALAAAIARLVKKKPPVPLVIVHGGGREIDAALTSAGIEKRQVDGLRITDAPTLEIVVGVLAGLVNTRVVAALGAAGVSAVGLTGADGSIGLVAPAAPLTSTSGATIELGYVGEPVGKTTPTLLTHLCGLGYVPVVSSIGASRRGDLFNVNADTLAANLAGRLKSPRLVIAGATAGVLAENGATIAGLTFLDIERLIASGGATAGMIAKLNACRTALERGAGEVFVANGKDLPGLAVLIRHGRAPGAALATRIGNGRPANGRKTAKRKVS